MTCGTSRRSKGGPRFIFRNDQRGSKRSLPLVAFTSLDREAVFSVCEFSLPVPES